MVFATFQGEKMNLMLKSQLELAQKHVVSCKLDIISHSSIFI